MTRFVASVDAHLYADEYGGNLSRDGLEVVKIMQDNMERVLLNLAPDKPVPNGYAGAGTPVVHASGAWVELSGADYFMQHITDAPNMTFYSVIRSLDTLADDAHRPTFWTNGLNLPANGDITSSFGFRKVVTAAGAMRFGAGFGNTVADDATITDSSIDDLATWTLHVDKVWASGPNQGIMTWNVTDNLAKVYEGTALPRFPVIGDTRIGSTRNQDQLGTNQQKWLVKYNKATTDEEDARNIAQIVDYERKRWGLDLKPW
jgi:hypothetical protein